MKFEEKQFTDLTDIPFVFVYFLLQGDEVVYVGQTTRGLQRVYQHILTKNFNKIYIIEVDEEELDYQEDFYIDKYKPKYNKLLKNKFRIEISSAASRINKELNPIKKLQNRDLQRCLEN